MTYSILISSKQLHLLFGIIALLALLIAVFGPLANVRKFRDTELQLQRLTRTRSRAVLVATIAPLLLRLALLPIFPQPVPYVHDEFSYLLMGDTFAHARLTNPVPPRPEHFETEYVLLNPTYASQYQPAQGLALAAAQVVTGSPWWGVWMTTGLMCGAICWALTWLFPLPWAVFGAFAAVLQIGVFGFWMNSYFGGAVAAMGGALVAGALLRMRVLPRSSGLICASGLVILFASRPLEGCLWAAAAAVWILVKHRRDLRMIVFPAVLVVAAGLGALAYYDARVTGRPLVPPYLEGRMTYGTPQSFWWQPPVIVNHFDNPQLRENYLNQLNVWGRRDSISGLWDSTWRRLRDFWRFFLGPFLTPALFFLLFLRRDRRIRPWLLVSIPFVIDHATYHAWYPQHSAPEAILIVMILVQSWRHMRVWRRRSRTGLAFSRNLAAGFAFGLVFIVAGRAAELVAPHGIGKIQKVWASLVPPPRPRDRVISSLKQLEGRHLVFVHYGPKHPYYDEWVFNGADIPGDRVVFAREVSAESDAALIGEMKGYNVWNVDPDTGLLSMMIRRGEPPALTATNSRGGARYSLRYYPGTLNIFTGEGDLFGKSRQ